MYEWMIDLKFHLRSSSSNPVSGSSSSGTEFYLLLSWNLLCNFHPFTPDCAQKYGLASNQTLAHVCPLVSHRVMKSVFPFLLLPAPAIGLLPAVCPAGPSLRLSSPHISYQPSSVHISVFQSVQNLDWHICLHLVHVRGACGFRVCAGPN